MDSGCQCCGVMQRLLQSYLQSAASLIGREDVNVKDTFADIS
jgi:hypothetical protein